jgi:hypothetical protein
MTPLQLRPTSGKRSADRRTKLERTLAAVATAGPAAIDARLEHLSREWSTGRLSKAVAGIIVLLGLALVAVSPWFLYLAALGGLMMAWYVIGGRSWIAAAFHAAGVRNSTEIHEEMMALKALRGDFKHLSTVHEIEDSDAISRLEGEGGIVFEPEHEKVHPREAVREAVTAARIATPVVLP